MNQVDNTVFKVYSKEEGYKLVWLKSYPSPILSEKEVEEILPITEENLFGPNLAYSSIRLSENKFFLATTSRWNIKGEFDRIIFSFSQGNLIIIKSDFPDPLINICECFINMLRMYKLGYKTLGNILAELFENESKNDLIRKIGFHLIKPSPKRLDKLTIEEILRVSNYLKQRSQNKNQKFRVYADFPYNENFSLCCLLGFQAISPDIVSVGGGYLKYPNNYNHISSFENIPGFEEIEIPLSEKLKQKTSPIQKTRQEISLSKADISTDKKLLYRLVNMFSLIFSLVSIIIAIILSIKVIRLSENIEHPKVETIEISKIQNQEFKSSISNLEKKIEKLEVQYNILNTEIKEFLHTGKPNDSTIETIKKTEQKTQDIEREIKKDIKWAQESLNELIGTRLVVDGNFGEKTKAAIKQFQKKYGLIEDGNLNPITKAKIQELLEGKRK